MRQGSYALFCEAVCTILTQRLGPAADRTHPFDAGHTASCRQLEARAMRRQHMNRPGFEEAPTFGAMNKSNKFSPEVRERAVRMVQEQRGEYPSLWAAVESIALKIGCSAHTLLEWVRRDEVDAGTRPGVTSAEAQRVKDLEREVKELRRANEILKLASAFFAQAELDR